MPFFSISMVTLLAIDPTSFSLEGYACTAWRHFFCQEGKPILSVSRSLNLFSAQPQTCSWGFKSGLYFGQSFKIEMLQSLKAFLAAGPCNSFSPSKRISKEVFVGKDLRKKGASFLRINSAKSQCSKAKAPRKPKTNNWKNWGEILFASWSFYCQWYCFPMLYESLKNRWWWMPCH